MSTQEERLQRLIIYLKQGAKGTRKGADFADNEKQSWELSGRSMAYSSVLRFLERDAMEHPEPTPPEPEAERAVKYPRMMIIGERWKVMHFIESEDMDWIIDTVFPMVQVLRVRS